MDWFGVVRRMMYRARASRKGYKATLAIMGFADQREPGWLPL
jgi:hypothetical protein